MLNIGIVGCGKIAQVRHIPEYAANENAVLCAFYNPTASRAEDMAAKYGGKVYATAEELFADPEIDAVSICAANYAHAELSIKALEAGKKTLIVLASNEANVVKSAANIPGVKTAQVNTINTYDIINADTLIIVKDAVKTIEEVDE